MSFNPCDEKITQVLIKVGEAIRKERGKPEEKNISILYEEAVKFLGIPGVRKSSRDVNHLPSPYETGSPGMKEEDAELASSAEISIECINKEKLILKLIEHKKDCPQCGRKKSMELVDVCRSCEDFKKGYRTEWKCGGAHWEREGKGCGTKELTRKFFSQWLGEFAKDDPEFQDLLEQVGMISKQDMGIKTDTDEGIK